MSQGIRDFRIVLFLILFTFSISVISCVERKSPTQDERATEEAIHDIRPVEPVLQWEFFVGRKVPEKLSMLSKTDEVMLADSIGNLLALSVEDGSVRTVVHVPGPITGWQQRVGHVATSSIDKHVRLNDIENGEELWSVPCETTPSEPVITPDVTVITAEGFGPYAVKCIGSKGGLKWRKEFPAKPSGYAPVITDGTAIYAFEDRYVRALSLADGTVLWEYRVNPPLEINPEGRWKGRYEFLGVEGDIAARNKPLQIGGIGRMPVKENGLIVPSEDGYVRCLDTTTGDLIWETKFDDRIWHVWASRNVSATTVYCDTIEGRFALLDASTGEIKSSVNLDKPTFGFVVYGPCLIVDSAENEGEVLLREPLGMSEVGRLKLGIKPTNGFMVDDKLITRTDDGRIVCFAMPEI